MPSIVKYPVLILIIFQIHLCVSQAPLENKEKLIVDYEGSSKIARLVGSEQPKYYVDLGAYDPVFLSNTLQMEMRGWQGVNVEPNHIQSQRFSVQRPGQTNLNMAVQDSIKLAMFYSLQRSELSTTNPGEQEKRNYLETLIVPSISLKELCERYYKTRPTLINIGFQEDADKALEGNNWALIKCIPDIFVVSNRKHVPSVLPAKYRQRLLEKQYKKFDILQWSDAEVYIKQTLFDIYSKNYQTSHDLLKQKQVIKFSDIITEFQAILNKRISQQTLQNEVGLYFAKKGEAINVENLLRDTQKLVRQNLKQEENPPTIVFNFKLKSNTIILSNCSFSIQKIVDQRFNFLNLTIAGEKKTSIYILDYKQDGDLVPKIVVLNELCSQKGTNFIVQGKYNQPNNPYQLSIGDYIIEIAFGVTFLVCFLSFTILIFFHLHASLKEESMRRNQRAANQESQLSTIN